MEASITQAVPSLEVERIYIVMKNREKYVIVAGMEEERRYTSLMASQSSNQFNRRSTM